MMDEHGRQLHENFRHPIREDMAFQRATWRMERIGWVLLAVLVLAALAGAAGGPLVAATARGEGVEVDHHRVERHGAANRLVIRAAQAGPDLTLRIDRAFLDAFTLDVVTPSPQSTSAHAEGIDMTFAASTAAGPAATAGPATIHVDILPRALGPVTSRIGLAGRQPAALSQFILP